MRILATTMGTTWAVVPELFAFTNPEQLPLYTRHPRAADFATWRERYAIEPADEVWVITTEGERVRPQRETLGEWANKRGIVVRQFSRPDLTELGSVEECHRMSDLISRVVLHAHERADSVFLSLAGGRKTMSADLQRAGFIFGCRAMLHVVDSGVLPPELRTPQADTLTGALAPELVEQIAPIVISGVQPPNPILHVTPEITAEAYPLDHAPADGLRLFEEIDHRMRDAGALLCNYKRRLVGGDQTNFRSLYALQPDSIHALQTERIAVRTECRETDLCWLDALPKAELHCHLGGILSPAEMIEVARVEAPRIRELRNRHPAFDQWLKTLEAAVGAGDSDAATHALGDSPKTLRETFPDIPQPCVATGALLAFSPDAELLDRVIYGELRTPHAFCGIGIERYEALGDFQGSTLLQSEATLRAACRVLVRQCRQHAVVYCELRCSPCNYTGGGLTPERVVRILVDELAAAPGTRFRLLFIASRHGRMSRIHEHVELAQTLLEDDPHFPDWFAGFDLAGAESAQEPEQLRAAFLPLMKHCLNLTIHAGEGEHVANIWQAVYHLNADRIGHGLTLCDDPKLMRRFLDRRIAVELCPSSNNQIVGFHNEHLPHSPERPYPLRDYLEKGLRVTVNTDDPGISRTNLTQEYYKAAAMTPGGLSKWQILQIVRNGFRASFAPFDLRKKLLLEVEKRILDNLLQPTPSRGD